jgi:N-acetylglutamate synthase-like GNAT family acetyltransferase
MSTETTTTNELLENLIWHSLVGPHAHLAEGSGPVRRYDPDVAWFVGVEHGGPDVWEAVQNLVGPKRTVILTGALVAAVPDGWVRQYQGLGHQMMLRRPDQLVPADPTVRIETMSAVDVPEMVALVEIAQPGPFRPRTIEMGAYFGVFDDDRQLIGLAGERLRAGGYTEISAVATHPNARRQGFASLLTSHVARHIASRGETPLLHVASTNDTAKRVYDRLGFESRKQLDWVAVETP